MDEAWFHSLPALCRNRKYSFEEMHAIACPSPKPVAVKVGSGYRKLPIELWPAAEFIAAALQGEEVFEREACNIDSFLLQLLRKAVVAADSLGSRACLGPKRLLSLFAARAKPSATVATPRNGTAPGKQDIEADVAMLQVNVGEPEKLADGCAGASVLQGEQMGLEKLSYGQACVNLSEEQRGAAEGHDECLMCHEQAVAAAVEDEEEEPSEEVKTTPRAEPSPQETGKRRRRKKRRERLRQKAKA